MAPWLPEVDLAKAFDTTPHKIASTPEVVDAWVSAPWRAPRSCHVAGDLAEPLMRTAGTPAGDPLCPRVLGLVIEPWDKTVRRERPKVKPWAYLDDRSLKAVPTREDCINGESLQPAAVRLMDDALTLTADFDSKVGLAENQKKGSSGRVMAHASTWAFQRNRLPLPKSSPGQLSLETVGRTWRKWRGELP